MLLIADSGSTKADWTYVSGDGQRHKISTKGINPVFHDEVHIKQAVLPAFGGVDRDAVQALFYYGSGCWDEQRKSVVRRGLSPIFPNAELVVRHDLDGAAKATCGDQAGIACILGTGSNSCLYDGTKVIDNVTNLGYLLGDEGSGTHLGKHLIRAYFYREMPKDLHLVMEEKFPGGKKAILDNIYTPFSAGKAPNVYLASLAKIVADYDEHPFIRNMVKKSFGEFVKRHVRKYEDYRELPIHFVGSIAFHFGDILAELLRKRSLHLGHIIRKPIDALVEYHLQQPV